MTQEQQDRLKAAAGDVVDVWDEYERGKLARLIVQTRVTELADVLNDIERTENP